MLGDRAGLMPGLPPSTAPPPPPTPHLQPVYAETNPRTWIPWTHTTHTQQRKPSLSTPKGGAHARWPHHGAPCWGLRLFAWNSPQDTPPKEAYSYCPHSPSPNASTENAQNPKNCLQKCHAGSQAACLRQTEGGGGGEGKPGHT